MNLAEIFYLTATVVLVLIGVVSLYIAYQIYKLSLVLKASTASAKQALSFVKTARFTAQAAILKSIVKILGGRGGDNNEK